MKLLAVTALILALASPALAQQPQQQDQADTMAYVTSLQNQRNNALNASALAEGQREWLRGQLTKAQAEIAELRKKLEEKAAPQP